MRTVTVRVRKIELASRMAAMRTWFDERSFGPMRFRCEDGNGDIIVHLGFENPAQAEAFVAAFDSGTRAAFAQPSVEGQRTDPEIEILIVDDEPDIRMVVSNILSCDGFKIIEAASAAEALYHLRSHDNIGLLFTDIVMPGGIDGFKLAQQARELRPYLPVIYTTGYVKELPLAGEAISNGTMLRKPFASQKLVAEVRRALA